MEVPEELASGTSNLLSSPPPSSHASPCLLSNSSSFPLSVESDEGSSLEEWEDNSMMASDSDAGIAGTP